MLPDDTLQASNSCASSRKHNLYSDVVQSQWLHMDSQPDWPPQDPGWVDMYHSDQRVRRDRRDVVTPVYPSYYPTYSSSEGLQQQYRQGRSSTYRSPVSPATPTHEDPFRSYYQPAPRCASQPNRLRDESLPSGWPETTRRGGRRESHYGNDMDYQLFVEATSGLSPDSSHHWSFDFPSTWRREQYHQYQQINHSHHLKVDVYHIFLY